MNHVDILSDNHRAGIKDSGKALIITSGIHGNECSANVTVGQLINCVNAGSSPFSGYDIYRIIRCINEAGIDHHEREWVDSDEKTLDINRNFYIDSGRFNSCEDACAYVKTAIKTACTLDASGNRRIVYVIDVHNSPACRNMVLLNYADPRSDELLAHFTKCGLMCCSWNSTKNTLKDYANSIPNVCAITVELSGMGILREREYRQNLEYLSAVIRAFSSYTPSGVIPMVDSRVFRYCCISSQMEGFAELALDYDDVLRHHFQKGEEICRLVGADNMVTEIIRAPENGIIVAWNPDIGFYGKSECIYEFWKD